ncbi:hypothetical protein VP1G_07509 [Cytospora mali]|uniref:Uncharacterized protein n=1 Tax=Cytospora mali TaxID=578113 RepID=A0A194V907_CYTMA|nr:hypothetical protein VP1G_07509 [Valsa mali var. pyri (nom. inval.)]
MPSQSTSKADGILGVRTRSDIDRDSATHGVKRRLAEFQTTQIHSTPSGSKASYSRSLARKSEAAKGVNSSGPSPSRSCPRLPPPNSTTLPAWVFTRDVHRLSFAVYQPPQADVAPTMYVFRPANRTVGDSDDKGSDSDGDGPRASTEGAGEDMHEPNVRDSYGDDRDGASGTSATSGPKRKRGPEEDCALQSPVKRTRAGTNTRTTGTTATPGSKEKIGQEEDADLITEYQLGTKRRRTDARPLLPPAATKGSKRRAGKNTKTPSLQQQLQPLASPGPSPASVVAAVAANADESKRGSSSATKERRQSPTRSPTRRPTHAPLRVTRAQRRLLSGKDTQLFQLGQRGELDVQRPSGQEDTSADTACKRRPARTGTGKSRQRR